jgi:hypothetical protein
MKLSQPKKTTAAADNKKKWMRRIWDTQYYWSMLVIADSSRTSYYSIS